MYYVIMDLEWNNVFVKRLKGYINEIIEIGAVMLDEDLNPCEEFSCLIKSQLGRRLNSHVKELTHITNEELSRDGISFAKAMNGFEKWLDGKDTVFVTWGNCDIRSLLDNFSFFLEKNTIPFITKYLDLQSYCQSIVANGVENQVGLAAAADKMNIPTDSLNSHRALDDSRLAAHCLIRSFDRARIDRYITECDESFYKRLVFKTVPITDINDSKIDKGLMRCKCDYCGTEMSLYNDWTSANNGFKAVFVCHKCNLFKRCSIRFLELTGGMDVKISYRTAHELTDAEVTYDNE